MQFNPNLTIKYMTSIHGWVEVGPEQCVEKTNNLKQGVLWALLDCAQQIYFRAQDRGESPTNDELNRWDNICYGPCDDLMKMIDSTHRA